MNDLKIAESGDVAVTVAVKRSQSTNQKPNFRGFTGAACQNRTDDLLITSEMLYRLS
jgi:hypothetical protein